MKRRTFLHACLGMAALGSLRARAEVRAARRLHPVQVSPERVTRTVVGLRPYRRNGFRCQAARLGEKLLVHNYGHGGAGITLSWGCAQLAVELAWSGPQQPYAVLGCGVMGLSTARLLQQRGGRVTIYARDLPPHTTSNIAGGQWGLASVADRDRRTPAFDAQLSRAARLAYRAFQDYVGPEYGVRWLENYFLSDDAPKTDQLVEGADHQLLTPDSSPFPGLYSQCIQTMMIEPAHYLNRLVHEVLEFGGRIEVRDFPDQAALYQLAEPVLINCTGLGSRQLFNDPDLVPKKGQMAVLLPQSEIDYGYLYGGYYMFPRPDGILLGGTYETGVDTLEVNEKAQQRILKAHAELMERLRR